MKQATRPREALAVAEGAQPAAYTALRVADSNARGFIARAIHPATSGEPFNLQASPIGGGKILAQRDGARRANSFNFDKEVVGTDTASVKVANTDGTQQTVEGLPSGANVKVTVAGVMMRVKGRSARL